MKRCPTCGSPVRVISADEGTSHFEPLIPEGLLEEMVEACTLLVDSEARDDGELDELRAVNTIKSLLIRYRQAREAGEDEYN